MLPLNRILETALYVDDLDAAKAFYGKVLGLELDSEKQGSFVFFRCGETMLLLFDPKTSTIGQSLPAHGSSGPGHACFAVDEPLLDAWRDRLAIAGIEIEHETTWPRGGRSFYFRDPAGNSLEIATPKIWAMQDVAP